MTRKEKSIAWAAVLAGAVIGVIIGFLLYQLSITRLAFMFMAGVGILATGVPVYTAICETRNEAKQQAMKSYPANWGFDKSYEE